MAGLQDPRQCLRTRPLSASVVTDMLDQLVVFPDPPSPDLARTLDLGGYRWKAVRSADDAAVHEPAAGWPVARARAVRAPAGATGSTSSCDTDPEGAWAFCRALRKRDGPTRLLLLLSGS